MKKLTQESSFANTNTTQAKSCVRFGDLNTVRRIHRRLSGFFVSGKWQVLLWAGHMGDLRVCRCPYLRFANLYGSVHPFGEGWRLRSSLVRIIFMHTSTSNENISPIVQLGEHLAFLVKEQEIADELGYSRNLPANQSEIYQARSGHLQDLICETYINISNTQAQSASDAAVQIRAVSYLAQADNDYRFKAVMRLCFSILGYLESTGGGSRDKWAGEYCLPERCDPFRKPTKEECAA